MNSDRWMTASFIFGAITLVMIAISNACGVGHSWPFLAVGIPLICMIVTGVKAMRDE